MMDGLLGFLFAVIVVLAALLIVVRMEGVIPNSELRNETQAVRYPEAKPAFARA